MVAVNQEQLIGSIIPDVYIRAVTLETSGTPIRETNPHIDVESSFGGLSGRPSRITQADSDNFLIINLDLLLKEQLTTGAIGTWFSNQDFKKYLQLTVVQSTDPLVTKLLSASNNALHITNMSATEAAVFLAELMDTEESKSQPEFSPFGGGAPVYSKDDLPELTALVKNNTEIQTISVSRTSDTILEQQYSSTTSTGERVFDFTFRVRFEVPTKTPEHLSYFAVSKLDVGKLVEDFKLDASDTQLFDLMSGKVAVDGVIANGSLVSKSFVYKDRDGNIWSGPVHQAVDGGGWFTGTVESGIMNPVTREVVENNKIQDFRDFDSMERLQLDFSVLQNSEFSRNLPFIRLTNDNMDVPRTESYFSDIALSKDSRGNCRYAFALDYKKLIRNHSKYGSLYSSSNLDELFDNVKIRSLIFKRRRVKRELTTSNQLGSPTDKREIYDIDAPDEILSYGGESLPGVFESPSSIRGTMREINFAMNKAYDGLRHFTGVDGTIRDTTDGFYQYGIEIEVQDDSVQLIKKKIKELSQAKYWLDYYYNTAILPNHFDTVSNRFTQEFIDKMYGQYATATSWAGNAPWISPLIVYLNVLSFFRGEEVAEKFAAATMKYTDPKSGNPRGIVMWVKLIENMLQRLSAAVGINLSEQRESFVKDSEGNYTRPPSVLIPGKPPIRTFKIEYYFPHTYDSNIPKDLGYDYLSNWNLNTETNDDGLKFIAPDAYTDRASYETLKYFTETAPNIDMQVDRALYTEGDSINGTHLAYLSPSSVNLGPQGNISLRSEPFNAEVCSMVQATIANINLSRNFPIADQRFLNNSTQASQNNIRTKSFLTNIMANFNCTLETDSPKSLSSAPSFVTEVADLLGEGFASIDQIQTSANDPSAMSAMSVTRTNVDPTPLFSEMAFSLITEGTGISGINSKVRGDTGKENGIARKQRRASYNMNYYNLESNQGVIHLWNTTAKQTEDEPTGNNFSVPPALTAKLKALPNQIKSLFLMSTVRGTSVRHNWSTTPMIQSPHGKAVINLNYKTLRRVEVFRGYGTDASGSPLLKKPEWVTLSQDVFNGASEGALLCRIVKHEDKDFGVQEVTGLRLPTYNKYFIIGNPGDASQARESISQTYTKRVAKRIEENLKQHEYLSNEYLSAGWVSPSTVKVSPFTRQRVLKTLDLSRDITQPNETRSR